MKCKVFFVLLSLLLPLTSNSQINQTLEDLFKNNRKGIYQHQEIFNWLEKNTLPKQELYNYALEGNKDDAYFFFQLVYQETLKEKDKKKATENVSFLVDKGLSGDHLSIERNILNYLNNFSNQLFTPSSKSLIASKIVQNSANLPKLIQLSGKLKIESLLPHYESMLINEKVSSSLKWQVRLAMGKMGDVKRIEECLDLVKSIGMNDQVVFNLIPDLIYLNNRMVFDFIMDEILKDEKQCTSTNPDNEVAINCAYRLIEVLAPYILDFPIKLYDSGDIITDEYEMSLNEVRQWIEDKNYMYEIR